MAEFCKQCADDLDFEPDFVGIGASQNKALGPNEGWVVLCEGCGLTLVNEAGECIAKECPVHGTKS